MPVVERNHSDRVPARSAESPGLTLGLEQSEDVALSDGALDVADQGSLDGALELDLNLRNTSSRAWLKQTRPLVTAHSSLSACAPNLLDAKPGAHASALDDVARDWPETLTGFADDFLDDSVHNFRVHVAI